MSDQNYKEIQENLLERAEDIKLKACKVEEEVSENIDELMSTTAEKLDTAADKMKSTAEFFRSNNVNKLKDDFSGVVKKNPVKSICGAVALGFLVGKIIFK